VIIFYQNGEEYFEHFPKFMKYNDNVVPCKETYACIFIGIITSTKSDIFNHSRLYESGACNQRSSSGQEKNDHHYEHSLNICENRHISYKKNAET